MQSANSLTGMQTMLFAPPYPAALSIPSLGWRSHLARDGKIPLAKPVIQIGRMEGNDVVLSDPLVSRHHAVVRWNAGGYEIEDLGAPNGTFVEGQRVSGRVGLAPGNLVRLGSTELVFQVMTADQLGRDVNANGPADLSGQSSFVVRPALPGVDALGPAGRTLVAPSAPPPSAAPPPYRSQAAPFPQSGYPSMVAGSPALATSAHPYYAMMAQPAQSGLARIFRSQARMRYWRVFLLGLIAYAVVAEVMASTANLHLAPLEMLLASALVPVVFVIFCWEQNAFVDMPPSVVGITFASGAVLGISIAAILEPQFIPNSVASTGITLPIAVIIGVVEETAKVVSVAWFLRNRRLRSELDGLILGAAAGMGFSALETAGYGFAAFLQGFFTGANSPVATLTSAVHSGSSNMNHELLVRMALAVFGHGVWTAIVCAAIWRDRGQSTFRLTAGVLTAFGIAVGLHALWDWSPLIQTLGPQPSKSSLVLVTVLWYALIGGVGLLILRFFLKEAVERAKLGPYAPPPAPLLSALLRDLGDLFGGVRRSPAPAWGQPQRPPVGPPYAPSGPPAPPANAIPARRPPGLPTPRAPQVAPRPTYCPACSVSYPPETQRCSTCGGPVFPVPL